MASILWIVAALIVVGALLAATGYFAKDEKALGVIYLLDTGRMAVVSLGIRSTLRRRPAGSPKAVGVLVSVILVTFAFIVMSQIIVVMAARVLYSWNCPTNSPFCSIL